MNEELKDNLELATAEGAVQEETIEEYIPEMAKEESVCEVEPQVQPEVQSQVQPEAVLTQAEDGSWRHAENSPFSPFYVPDRKQKNNNRLTIGLIILLLLLLVGCLIFVVSKLIEAAVGEAADAWNKSTGAIEDFFDDLEDAFKEGAEEDSGDAFVFTPEEYDLPEFDDYDDFDYGDFGYQDEIYEPSPDDEYYVEFADAIRDDLSYSVTIDNYYYTNSDDSVYIWVDYAQVDGDIKNCDEINKLLLDNAMYHANMSEAHEIKDMTLEVETYVTYMDEDVLSVILDEYFYVSGEVIYDVYCMNFDLKTGELLNNMDIIKISNNLVEAFIEQSIYQNGYTASVTDYSKEEIADFMRDEESLILFYTPVGLEIGYNHPNGWVTATFKDYQQFLR